MSQQNSVIKSGFWKSEGGNPFWINVIEDQIYWLGMNNKSIEVNLGQNWCHVGFGKIENNFITLKWSDIAVGKDQLNGVIKIQIISNIEMIVVEDSGNFGKSKWIWQSKTKNFSQF